MTDRVEKLRPMLHLSLSVVSAVAVFCAIGCSLEEGLEESFLESYLRISSHPRAPQWFPDQSKLAFSHAGEVYVIGSDGSNLVVVYGSKQGPDFAYFPSVSSDGSRILYSSYEESGWFPLGKRNSWEIMMADPDGSSRNRLTTNEDNEVRPVWLPDASGIIFQSLPGGISTMSTDGSDVVRLANQPVEPYRVSGPSGSPVVSPNGRHIGLLLENYAKNYLKAIQIGGMDGSNLIVVKNAGPLAWSPDSRYVAYAKVVPRQYPNQSRLVVPSISIVEIETLEQRVVVGFPWDPRIDRVDSMDWSPDGYPIWVDSMDWSPDGSAILFGRLIIQADGSGWSELPGPGYHASWSPDSSRIAVYAKEDTDMVVYTMEPDGTDIRVLVARSDTTGELMAAGGRVRE